MDLAAELMQYAIESGEAVAVTTVTNPLTDAGATELTVVTDDTRTDLEECLSDVADDIEKLNKANAGAEKLVEASESLESMMIQLSSMESRGIPLDNAAAQIFLQGVALSLEARDIPEELFGADLLAISASFEANQLALPGPATAGGEGDNTKDAKSKTGGILSRIWNVLKAAVEGALERLTGFISRIGKTASAVKASGAKLKSVGKGVSGEATGKLKGSSYSKLVVGGKINPNAALDAVEKGWTTGVLEVTKDLREISKRLIDALSKADAGTIGAFARTIDTKLHAHKQDLTGGYAISFAPGQGGGFDGVMKAKFAISRGEAPKAGEDFDPLSGSDIVALGGRLESVGALMEKIATDSNESVRQARAIIDAAKKGADKGTDDAKEAQKLFSTAQAVVRQISSYAPEYVKFMGEIAKTAYSLGMASASKHKGGAAAAAPEKKDEGTKAIGQEKQAAIGNDKKEDDK